MRNTCKYENVDNQETVKQQLRSVGLRATRARVALVSLLARQAKPLDASDIWEKLGAGVDQATVYRALHSLVEAGLVKQVRILTGKDHYEFAMLPHHHHVTCERCGQIEDVTVCCDDPEPSTSSFFRVTHHSLEFSGICNGCAE